MVSLNMIALSVFEQAFTETWDKDTRCGMNFYRIALEPGSVYEKPGRHGEALITYNPAMIGGFIISSGLSPSLKRWEKRDNK